MSGESPREEKRAVRHTGISAERPYQATDKGVVEMAMAMTPASRQQLIVCAPLGQHGFLCAVSARLSIEVWQSGCIDGGAAASTRDPCKPRAISTIQAMN